MKRWRWVIYHLKVHTLVMYYMKKKTKWHCTWIRKCFIFKRETEIQTGSDKVGGGGGADRHSANSYTNILKVSLREVGFYATSIRLQMIHGQKAQSDNQTNATLYCLSNSVKLDPRFPGLCIPQWRWEGGKWGGCVVTNYTQTVLPTTQVQSARVICNDKIYSRGYRAVFKTYSDNTILYVNDTNTGGLLRGVGTAKLGQTARCSVTGMSHWRMECVTAVTKEGTVVFDLSFFLPSLPLLLYFLLF